MINLLVVDDHSVVRAGLKQILVESPHICVVAEASSTSEALNKLRDEKSIDLVLLDISLPDKIGLEALKEIRKHFPEVKVMMLTMHSEDQYAIRSFRAGAHGYITKGSSPQELIFAIQKVHSGGKYMNPSLAETLVTNLDEAKQSEPLHQTLSDREFEVLKKLGNGKTIGEIAKDLTLSTKTVSTYRARILEKMNLKTTAEIIRYAIENGVSS